MSNKDLVELVRLIQNGIDVKFNMEKLYIELSGYIYKVAYPYSSKFEIEELKQEAYFELNDAVNKYPLDTDVKFITYAGYRIKDGLSKFVNSNAYTQKIPRYLVELMIKYQKFQREYKLLNNNQVPSKVECMEHLQLSEKRLNNLLKVINDANCVSMDKVVPGTEDLTLCDIISDDFNLELDVVERLSDKQANKDIMTCINELNTKYKNVIYSRYRDNMSVTEVAKLYNISTSMVKKIEEKALMKLRNDTEIQELGELWGVKKQVPR